MELRKACSVLAEAYEENPLPRQGEKGLYAREDDEMDDNGAKTRSSPLTTNGNAQLGILERERLVGMSEGSEEGEV